MVESSSQYLHRRHAEVQPSSSGKPSSYNWWVEPMARVIDIIFLILITHQSYINLRYLSVRYIKDLLDPNIFLKRFVLRILFLTNLIKFLLAVRILLAPFCSRYWTHVSDRIFDRRLQLTPEASLKHIRSVPMSFIHFLVDCLKTAWQVVRWGPHKALSIVPYKHTWNNLLKHDRGLLERSRWFSLGIGQ